MNVLVIGCGKVGVRLAEVLSHYGHNVSIVDGNAENFTRLSDDFDGLTITGMPMDMTVLRSAGVEACDAVAVVTSDDNLNITVSQIIKEFFGVQNVVSRISDPAREAVFHHFGLKTICSTKLTSSAIMTALTQPWDEKQITFETCTMAFRVQKVESVLIGRTLDAVPVRSGEIITGVLHGNGSTTLYDGRQKIVLQPDDRIIYTYLCD